MYVLIIYRWGVHKKGMFSVTEQGEIMNKISCMYNEQYEVVLYMDWSFVVDK